MALNEQEFEKLKIILSQKEGNVKSGTKSFLQKSLPIAGMVLGGIGGGIVGGATTGVGAVPGAIAGAGVGGALGEAGAEKLAGEELEPKKIITAGLEGSVSELAGTGIIKGIGLVAKPVLKFAGKILKPLGEVAKAGWKGVRKVLPGISDDTARTIVSKADRVETLAKQKTLPVNYLIDDIQNAANKFEKEFGESYESQWQKLLAEGNKYVYNKDIAINSINEFLEIEAKKGNAFFKLGKNGKLDFSASPFTKNQQQNVVKAMVDEINTSQPKNIAEIRALKQRLNAIYQEYSAQFGANPQLNRVVSNMVNAVDEALPKELRSISKEYSEGLKFLAVVDELLLPTSKTTGELKGSVVSKVKSIGKEEIKELYGDFLDDFYKKTGYNLEEELDIYNAAREINPNLIPQDTGGITRGIQRAMNPFIGMLKVKQAQGLIPTAGGVVEKVGEQYQGFKPIVDFLKDNTIPAAVKSEIMLTLQELFEQK